MLSKYRPRAKGESRIVRFKGRLLVHQLFQLTFALGRKIQDNVATAESYEDLDGEDYY
jgi:hypothetical protein